MASPIKTITAVLKVLTYIITSITKTLCQFGCVYLYVNLWLLCTHAHQQS